MWFLSGLTRESSGFDCSFAKSIRCVSSSISARRNDDEGLCNSGDDGRGNDAVSENITHDQDDATHSAPQRIKTRLLRRSGKKGSDVGDWVAVLTVLSMS